MHACIPRVQRHGSGTVGMSQIVGAAGGAGRIFAALLSGHDHVAAEAARLLLRFFAPSAARAGASPWAGGLRGSKGSSHGPAPRGCVVEQWTRIHDGQLGFPNLPAAMQLAACVSRLFDGKLLRD